MLIYIGEGWFLPGVPARDLSAEEVKRFGGEKYLIASGLYKKAPIGQIEKGDKK